MNRTRPGIAIPVAIAVCLLTLVLAIALGVAASGDNVLPGDVEVTIEVQRVDGAIPDALASIANAVGSTLWASIAIAVVLLVAVVRRAWPEAVFLVTLLVLRLAGTQLKPLFDSPRPTDDLVLVTGTHDGTGYPSGHTLTGATLTLGLAVLAWRYIPSRPLRGTVIALLLALGLLIGWARVYSGAHWPTDVYGGYLFGVATVCIGIAVLNRAKASAA